MNPETQARIQRINQSVDDLRLAIRDVNAAVDRHQDEKEKLVQDQWRKSKMLATLQYSAEDFQALTDEIGSLKKQRSTLKEHLRRLRNYTKALSGELRS